MQAIAGSQLGRMLGGRRGGSKHLSAGEIEKRLNAIGRSTRVRLDPELLRQVSRCRTAHQRRLNAGQIVAVTGACWSRCT